MKTTTCEICGNVVPGIENDQFVCCAVCHEEFALKEREIFLREQDMRIQCSEFAFQIQNVCLECGELVNEVDGCGRCIPCAVANPADEYCPHCGDYFLL